MNALSPTMSKQHKPRPLGHSEDCECVVCLQIASSGELSRENRAIMSVVLSKREKAEFSALCAEENTSPSQSVRAFVLSRLKARKKSSPGA